MVMIQKTMLFGEIRPEFYLKYSNSSTTAHEAFSVR